jgi:H+/gluconate symporter-like permease
VVGVAILIIFLGFAGLMAAQKMPVLLALPTFAILVALIAGVPLYGQMGLLQNVIEDGAIRLASSYIAVIFGAWLGTLMNLTGITQRIVKLAAELAGENRYLVAITLAAATAAVFTTIGGLGAIIIVGSIVLPILLSVGIKPLSAASIFLMGFATGLPLNLPNWQFYSQVTGVPLDDVRNFAFIMVGLTALATLVLIVLELRGQGERVRWSATPTETTGTPPADDRSQAVPWYALVTPFVPLVMVIVFKWPIISSLTVGIVYAIASTRPRNPLGALVRTATEAVANGAPAVLLMVVIGMVLNAVLNPQVSNTLVPILGFIAPTNIVWYILLFGLLAPLALYRGPLNLFGLGAGLAGLLIGNHLLSPTATMGGFLADERTQVVGDPTNTQNVWTSDFTSVEVNRLTLKLLPYLWPLSFLGAIIAALLFFR